MQLIFDGHNDVLLRLWRNARNGADPAVEMRDGTSNGHIDIARARAGGLAGGFCAIYIPSKASSRSIRPMPTATMRRRLRRRCRATPRSTSRLTWPRSLWNSSAPAPGGFAARPPTSSAPWKTAYSPPCCTWKAARRSMRISRRWRRFYAAGLRSLGPVWSRNNIFGHGVPFAYPMSPDTGPGLTEAGKRLVKACNRLGILIDLAHITEKGFWDVAKTFRPAAGGQPLQRARDDAGRAQPDRPAARRGAREQGAGRPELRRRPCCAPTAARTPTRRYPTWSAISTIWSSRLGIDGVAHRIGLRRRDRFRPRSATRRACRSSLPRCRSAGYGDADLAKICRENWLRVLRSAWHERLRLRKTWQNSTTRTGNHDNDDGKD